MGLGVSCSADRNAKAKITPEGIFIEQLETNPGQYIPEALRMTSSEAVSIDLNRPMKEVLEELGKYPVTTRLSLNGTIIVARDIAHAKLKERLEKGEGLPQYMKDHPCTTPARPKLLKATPPVPSAPRPQAAWIPT